MRRPQLRGPDGVLAYSTDGPATHPPPDAASPLQTHSTEKVQTFRLWAVPQYHPELKLYCYVEAPGFADAKDVVTQAFHELYGVPPAGEGLLVERFSPSSIPPDTMIFCFGRCHSYVVGDDRHGMPSPTALFDHWGNFVPVTAGEVWQRAGLLNETIALVPGRYWELVFQDGEWYMSYDSEPYRQLTYFEIKDDGSRENLGSCRIADDEHVSTNTPTDCGGHGMPQPVQAVVRESCGLSVVLVERQIHWMIHPGSRRRAA